MLIGVDFDNTIVSYDTLFHRVAADRGLIPASLPASKRAVRDYLREAGREDAWTEMQGEVYGARLDEAEPFPGVLDFFRACRANELAVVIVSHKTRHPYRGESYDLHAAARRWLAQHGLADIAVHLELTKAAKLARIAALGCTHFIDDLPEILGDPAFPATVRKVLFDPTLAAVPAPDVRSYADWPGLSREFIEGTQLQRLANRVLGPLGHLAREPAALLAGGANNRVGRVVTESRAEFLVKRYFQHPGDCRDRLGNERAFYPHAAATSRAHVPAAHGWGEDLGVGVFEFVAGTRPTACTPRLFAAALDFVVDLNRGRNLPSAARIPSAAEACFSMAEHLQTVDRRVQALVTGLADEAEAGEVGALVKHELVPAWEAIRHATAASTDPLPTAARCLSPSDFGFHNALETPDGRVVFFDFEYAGWDDPAKLVCDFFCQPEVPVPLTHWDAMVRALAGVLDLEVDFLAERCRTLLPVYRLKWGCILLNEFTAVGRRRRQFSLGPDALESRCRRQLARARALLGTLPFAA